MFKPDVRDDRTLELHTEKLEEPRALFIERVAGSEEGGLLIDRVSVESDQTRGDEDGVFLEEDRRRRVDGEVAASSVRCAQTTIGIRRSIGFALFTTNM